jgi:hypothetical protein
MSMSRITCWLDPVTQEVLYFMATDSREREERSGDQIELSKAHPTDLLPPSRHHPLKFPPLPKTALPTGDQVDEHVSLLENISYSHHNSTLITLLIFEKPGRLLPERNINIMISSSTYIISHI